MAATNQTIRKTRRRRSPLAALLVALFLVAPQTAAAQQEPAPQTPVAIADGPTAIDPATLMPAALAARESVRFQGESLLEFADWFSTEQQVPVLIDKGALAELAAPLGEPVYDQLEDQPLYFLLDRLKSLQLGWHSEDGYFSVPAE